MPNPRRTPRAQRAHCSVHPRRRRRRRLVVARRPFGTTSTDDALRAGQPWCSFTPQIAGIVIRINADDTALVREGDPGRRARRRGHPGPRSTRRRPGSRPGPCARVPPALREYRRGGAPSVELRRAEWRRAREDLPAPQRDCRTPGGARRRGPEARRRHSSRAPPAALRGGRAAGSAASEALVFAKRRWQPIPTSRQGGQRSCASRISRRSGRRCSRRSPATSRKAQRAARRAGSAPRRAPLLAIVPLGGRLGRRETSRKTQLEYVRIGQPATLTSDLYGKARSRITAPVIGARAGARAARSRLLPPQETRPATGSRIVAAAAGAHPARPGRSSRRTRCGSGLSMNASIDTHDRSGPGARQHPADRSPVAATQAYEALARRRPAGLEREIVQAKPSGANGARLGRALAKAIAMARPLSGPPARPGLPVALFRLPYS